MTNPYSTYSLYSEYRPFYEYASLSAGKQIRVGNQGDPFARLQEHALRHGEFLRGGMTNLTFPAEVAPSTAHQVLSTLEREAIVESTGRGPGLVRRLCDPGALLISWAEAHSLKEYKPRSYYRWMQSPAQLRELVSKEFDLRNISTALTLTSGAELSTPHATV